MLVAAEVFKVMVVPPKEAVDEACRTPATWREEATVEEPEEMNPPINVPKPDTDKVDEADKGPAICIWAAIVEEAEMMMPSVVVSGVR